MNSGPVMVQTDLLIKESMIAFRYGEVKISSTNSIEQQIRLLS